MQGKVGKGGMAETVGKLKSADVEGKYVRLRGAN